MMAGQLAWSPRDCLVRKIAFDFSRFADFVFQPGPTGIARVDLAFGRFLVENPEHFAAGIHDRFGIRTQFSLQTLKRLLKQLDQNWNEENHIPIGQKVDAWLTNPDSSIRRIRAPIASTGRIARGIGQLLTGWPWHNPTVRIPEGAVYLNVAYGSADTPDRLEWLTRRPDIVPAFLVHDLIPLDFPEFFWNQNDTQFPQRIETVLRHASIAITTTECMREQLSHLAKKRGRQDLKVHTASLPPGDAFLVRSIQRNRALQPYFVICGTIEPRKNHLLLLNIWRQRLQAGLSVPKLLVIGQRGWKNENVIDTLERSPYLAGHVLEVSGLSTTDMTRLVAGAHAALVPSFAEGFGLPVVEALALGTPVIASDIPVFKEVSQGNATFLSPLDGPAWEKAILTLCENNEALVAARSRATRFAPQTNARFFDDIMQAIGSH